MQRYSSFVFLSAVLALAGASTATAQTARVQVIHNAADPAAAAVDVYLDDVLLLDDFEFRSATPFSDVPAAVEIVIGIAPSASTGPADILASFPVTLETDESYTVIATGVLDPGAFAPNPEGREIGFELLLRSGARESAVDPAQVDVFGVHGITDAPALDVLDDEGTALVEDAGYGDMTEYLSFDEGVVVLEITPAGDNDSPLSTVEVDLTGVPDSSAVVLASGFWDPSANQDGPTPAALVVFPSGEVIIASFPPPDDGDEGCTYSKGYWKNHPAAWPPSPSPDDPFLNSSMTWMEVLWTPPKGGNAYIQLGRQYAAAQLNILTGASDAEVASELERARELLEGSSPEDPPSGSERKEFHDLAETLDAYNNGQIGPGHCDDRDEVAAYAWMQIVHNAADPALDQVDVYLGEDLILDDFGFRTATPFVRLPADVPLQVGLAPSSSSGLADTVRSFTFTLDENGRYFAVASGVVDTTMFEQNPDGRDTGLSVYVREDPPEEESKPVKVPRGHYPPPASCRLWYRGTPPGHQPEPVPCTELDGKPNDALIVTSNGVWQVEPENAAIVAGHHVTDAPTVDIVARDVGVVFDDVAYGDFTNVMSVPATSYVLDVTPGTDNDQIVASFLVDLTEFAGQSIAVLASGFLDPSVNQDGPPFALLAIFPDGSVAELPPETADGSGDSPAERRSSAAGLEQGTEIPESVELASAYPNPFNPTARIAFGIPEKGEVRLTVHDALGRLVKVLFDGQLSEGSYEMTFEAGALPSGLYVYRIQTRSKVLSNTMMLVK
jgi:hypothetical protein